MGYDINIIGRHRINTESIEHAAKELSDRFDINIEYGYEHEYDVSIKKRVISYSSRRNRGWISLGTIIRDSKKGIYRLNDKYHECREIRNKLGGNLDDVRFDYVYEGYFERGVQYELDYLEESDGIQSEISFLYLYKDVIEITFSDDPGRWGGFHQHFTEERQKRSGNSLRMFREIVRKYYKAAGCDYVYYYPDQDAPSMIDDLLDKDWEEIEAYITSHKYCGEYYERMDDYYKNDLPELAYLHTFPESRTINIPLFLTEATPQLSESYVDIFWDDFSDIDR